MGRWLAEEFGDAAVQGSVQFGESIAQVLIPLVALAVVLAHQPVLGHPLVGVVGEGLPQLRIVDQGGEFLLEVGGAVVEQAGLTINEGLMINNGAGKGGGAVGGALNEFQIGFHAVEAGAF